VECLVWTGSAMPYVGNAAATVVDNDLVMIKAAVWIVSEPI